MAEIGVAVVGFYLRLDALLAKSRVSVSRSASLSHSPEFSHTEHFQNTFVTPLLFEIDPFQSSSVECLGQTTWSRLPTTNTTSPCNIVPPTKFSVFLLTSGWLGRLTIGN